MTSLRKKYRDTYSVSWYVLKQSWYYFKFLLLSHKFWWNLFSFCHGTQRCFVFELLQTGESMKMWKMSFGTIASEEFCFWQRNFCYLGHYFPVGCVCLLKTLNQFPSQDWLDVSSSVPLNQLFHSLARLSQFTFSFTSLSSSPICFCPLAQICFVTRSCPNSPISCLLPVGCQSVLLFLFFVCLPTSSGQKCLRHRTRVLDTQVLISPTQEQVRSEVRA